MEQLMGAPERRPAPGERGFTLIEMMIALLVFGLGMVTLSSMQLMAMSGSSRGRHATQAAAVAESQMEQLQRLTWAQLGPTGGWSAPVTRTNSVQGQAEAVYSVDWRITDLVANWTRSVDVRVSWNDPGRPNRSVVLSGIRFNREGV